MTDTDIIKALECCYTIGTPCVDCPLCDVEGCNDTLMAEYVKDLINRQKAEIEEFQKHIDNDIIYVKRVKAEAVKEFAEIIKENQSTLFNLIYSRTAFGSKIDNLVKEMVGESNG